MSKEAIIEKILTDAEERVAQIRSESIAKAEEIAALSNEECNLLRAKNKENIATMIEDVKRRGLTVAELDARKQTLLAKTQILDQVYESALEKVRNLDKDTYKALILGMLEYAEDGDIVVISEREKDVVTEEVVRDLAKRKGISLTLQKEYGSFDGGLVFSGGGVDKNFTLKEEIAGLREETEGNFSKELKF